MYWQFMTAQVVLKLLANQYDALSALNNTSSNSFAETNYCLLTPLISSEDGKCELID